MSYVCPPPSKLQMWQMSHLPWFFPHKCSKSFDQSCELKISDNGLPSLPSTPQWTGTWESIYFGHFSTNITRSAGQSLSSYENPDDGASISLTGLHSPPTTNMWGNFHFHVHLIHSDATISKLRKTYVNGVFTEKSATKTWQDWNLLFLGVSDTFTTVG
jgi:hypothetical protein